MTYEDNTILLNSFNINALTIADMVYDKYTIKGDEVFFDKLEMTVLKDFDEKTLA